MALPFERLNMNIRKIMSSFSMQACMAGIVFAKFTKPTSRAETIMFSRNALVTMRNGALYLLVRLGDMRATRLIGCVVTGQLVSQLTTEVRR